MQQSVEQGPTVVTEGGRGVRVDLKLVLGTLSMELQQGFSKVEFLLEK